jgi:hypothetical protein
MSRIMHIFVTNIRHMDIKEFLKSHPFIKVYAIERELNLPTGTIRVNTDRKIPEKYQQLIIESLANYNPIKTHVVVDEKKVPEMPVILHEATFIPKGRQCIVKRVTKLGIGEHAYIFGKMEGGIFKRDNDIQDNTKVIIG